MQARNAALKLMDRGTGKAWRSILLDLDEERSMNFIVVEVDPGIESISGRETLLLSNPRELDVRDAFELSANRVQGRAIQSILYFS